MQQCKLQGCCSAGKWLNTAPGFPQGFQNLCPLRCSRLRYGPEQPDLFRAVLIMGLNWISSEGPFHSHFDSVTIFLIA